MFCKKCGKEILTDSDYCEECKNASQTATKVNPNEHSGKKKCCPKCKSRNLQLVTNTEFSSETKGGGYSASKGCCGYILAGPLGLLCGACGSKSKTTVTSKSTTVWTCLDCGNKFRDISDIKSDINSTIKTGKIFPIVFFVFGAFTGILTLMEILGSLSSMLLWGGINSSALLKILLSAIPSILFFGIGIIFKRETKQHLSALLLEKKEIEKNGYTN